jgi:zinc protease
VYEDQIATDVSAYAYLREIAGQFYITATARPGQDLQAVEQAIDEELDKLLKFGPTEQELKRVKTTTIANFVKGIERVGGFGGKSDILASYQVFCNDPAFYKVELARYQNATVKTLLEAGNKWLADGVFNLEVRPFPEYKTIASSVDRTTAPEPGKAPKAAFPAFQRKTLTNGMTLLFAERHSAPMVQCALIVDAGYAADSYAQPGTASLAMNMLDEGTTSRDALQISEELDLLGASIGSGSSVDVSTVTLNTLKTTLAEALTIYADIVLNPSFPEKEFLRLQKEQIARIQREKVTPMSMAVRVFPKLLYGEGHAYSNPLTGSGTEESVAGMTVADLKKFHETWFKPNNTTIVIVGDTQLDEITDQVEKAFASWKPGDVPQKKLAEVPQPEQSTLYLIDRPGSEQSVVLAGLLVPSKADPQDLAIATMNYSLGGAFTSRINMNLREDKHWTYGARSMVLDARAQRPFLAYASVQMDKTKESIQEIIKECLAFTGDTPPTEEELSNAINAMTLTLPGDWETMGAVLNSLSDMVNFGLPDDYYATYADSIRALQPTDVAAAAAQVVKPSQFVWVVVGDRAKIETSLTELGFAQIQQLDADGRILQP